MTAFTTPRSADFQFTAIAAEVPCPGPQGLGLCIVTEGIARLADEGVLLFYTGVPISDGVDSFRREVERIVPHAGFAVDYDEIDPDLFGEELDTPAYRTVDRIAAVAVMISRSR
jgi:hypothetical protein